MRPMHRRKMRGGKRLVMLKVVRGVGGKEEVGVVVENLAEGGQQPHAQLVKGVGPWRFRGVRLRGGPRRIAARPDDGGIEVLQQLYRSDQGCRHKRRSQTEELLPCRSVVRGRGRIRWRERLVDKVDERCGCTVVVAQAARRGEAHPHQVEAQPVGRAHAH